MSTKSGGYMMDSDSYTEYLRGVLQSSGVLLVNPCEEKVSRIGSLYKMVKTKTNLEAAMHCISYYTDHGYEAFILEYPNAPFQCFVEKEGLRNLRHYPQG